MIHYFGTNLTSAGHGFYICDGKNLNSSQIRYSDFAANHFSPELMPRSDKGITLPNGTVRFYREGGYTICAIQGSCTDSRGGSKSIFFTTEEMRFYEFVIKILSTPICKKIIKQMPFEVKWGFNEETTQKINEILSL